MIARKNRLTGIVLTVAFLLLIPFVAMQFSDEVNWSGFDFVVMGFLLLGTGLLCELVIVTVRKIEHRELVFGAVLVALFLLWIELPVGIFNSPFAGT
ncbi:MAG: hypothetical protein V4717_18840 [Bacteroidota bacterium]